MARVWAPLIFVLLQIIPFISCRAISAPSPYSPALFKRTTINLSGFPVAGSNGPTPITNDNVNAYIDQVADLAQYIVDHVTPNHALFLRFFGGNTYYNEAMSKSYINQI